MLELCHKFFDKLRKFKKLWDLQMDADFLYLAREVEGRTWSSHLNCNEIRLDCGRKIAIIVQPPTQLDIRSAINFSIHKNIPQICSNAQTR